MSSVQCLLLSVTYEDYIIYMETYHTTPCFLSLLNIVIVVFNVAALLFFGKLPRGRETKSIVVISAATLPFIMLLNFPEILNEYIYVLLIGILTSVGTCVTNVTVVQVPYYFDKYNDVARISGISNMCASFGILGGNYLYGLLADMFGWRVIMINCTSVVIVVALLTLIAGRGFNRFLRTKHKI